MKLPVFSGAKDKYLSCHQFLFIMEEMARINDWNNEEKLENLLECLIEDALEWINACHCSQDLASLKSALICDQQKLSSNLTISQKVQLKQSLIQKSDETVKDFYERCKIAQVQLCDQHYSDLLHEQELFLTFVLGLKTEISSVLIKQDFWTLHSFLEAAIKIETVHANANDLDFFDDIISSTEHENNDDVEGLLQDFKDIYHKCEQCGFSYTTQDLLEEHISKEHIIKKIKCPFCSVTCQSKKVFQYHLINLHPKSCHQCHLCDQVFTNTAKLSSHFCLKHQDSSSKNNLACTFCGKDYSNKNSLKAHIHSKHVNNKIFTCQVCNKTFTSSSNLKTHVRIVHLMERPYECDACGKSYASEGGLSAHQASIHGKGERLQCDQCDMSFPYKSALSTHVLNRHNRGTFICDECGSANNTKEALRVHKITDHSEDKGKKLPCPYAPECNEKFRVPFQVRNHVKRVHKKIQGNHLCSICPKKYHSKQRLESHMNGVHFNKKPHKCPHCEFASAYQGHVKDHIRASHDAVKFPCPYPLCNHQSSYKGNLDKHIRNIHTKNNDDNKLI